MPLKSHQRLVGIILTTLLAILLVGTIPKASATVAQPHFHAPPTSRYDFAPEEEAPAGSLFFQVGPGYTDVVPRQIVRTANDKVYIFAGLDDFSTGLRAYWTTRAGYPTGAASFNGSAQFNDNANIISVDAVYDGGNFIHVLVNNQAGQLKDYPFDLTANSFKAPIILVSGNPTIPTGSIIGTSGLSGLFDTAGILNLAYWSAGDHITYRAYTYNPGSNSLSPVGSPVQLDTAGSANHPALAISPFNGSVTVAWVSQATNPARILARTRSTSESWGGVENVSTAPVWISTNAGLNIDQGPSIVIDYAGVRHLSYMQNYDSTNDYGRVHYVYNAGSGWVDTALPAYTHDPALALNSAGDLYIFGHGGIVNSVNVDCPSSDDMCLMKRGSNGSWEPLKVFAAHSDGFSFDSSASVKWAVVGWNRPETVELLFFGLNTSTNAKYIYYGRLAPTSPPLNVTSNLDDENSPSTLRGALKYLADYPTYSPKIINLNLAPANRVIGLKKGLVVPEGVTINGLCSPGVGPAVTLNGSGITDDGVTLRGRNRLSGLKIAGFQGRQLVVLTGDDGNILNCLKTRRFLTADSLLYPHYIST